MDYLRQQRTRRALALLETTQLPITEVAQLVGLSRLSLWRSVSKLAGQNPKTVRAASRERDITAAAPAAAPRC
jgi:AraC-like DNA-binding protein